MKEKFETVEVTIIVLDNDDVIATSGLVNFSEIPSGKGFFH